MPAKSATFVLQPAPTFEATVQIPVPGGESRPLVLIFKHKTREEATALLARQPQKGDTDGSVFDEIVAGWRNVEEPYSPENMTTLCQNFAQAAEAIIAAYFTELGVFRRKN